jgi:hypothetical protein
MAHEGVKAVRLGSAVKRIRALNAAAGGALRHRAAARCSPADGIDCRGWYQSHRSADRMVRLDTRWWSRGDLNP